MKTATKTTRIIAGHSITLQPGVKYWASRPAAEHCTSRRIYPVSISVCGSNFDTPVFVVDGLSYDAANELLAAFNNGDTSFDGRVWDADASFDHAAERVRLAAIEEQIEKASNEYLRLARLHHEDTLCTFNGIRTDWHGVLLSAIQGACDTEGCDEYGTHAEQLKYRETVNATLAAVLKSEGCVFV